jgi:hypothetical protein
MPNVKFQLFVRFRNWILEIILKLSNEQTQPIICQPYANKHTIRTFYFTCFCTQTQVD